jgi:hypothetical protein
MDIKLLMYYLFSNVAIRFFIALLTHILTFKLSALFEGFIFFLLCANRPRGWFISITLARRSAKCYVKEDSVHAVVPMFVWYVLL